MSLADLSEPILASAGELGLEISVAVRDLLSPQTLLIEADRPFYAASLIKLPIMVATFELARQNRLALDETLALNQEDKVGGSGILSDLSTGLMLPIRDLLLLMIALSDNTATNMLLERIGVATVDPLMREFGLKNTTLKHKLMIVEANRQGYNHTSAADMVALLASIAHGEAVSLWACERMVEILSKQRNKSRLQGLLPQEPTSSLVGAPAIWRYATKAGNVDGYCHDVGLVYGPGTAYALALLTKYPAQLSAANAWIAQVSKLIFAELCPAPSTSVT